MLAPYLFLPFFLKFILQCFCLAIAQSLWFLHLDLSWCRRNYLGIDQRYTWVRSWQGPSRCYSNWCYVPIFLDLIGSLHPFHLWNKVYLISFLRSVQDLTENSWTRNIVKDLKDPFFISDCWMMSMRLTLSHLDQFAKPSILFFLQKSLHGIWGCYFVSSILG